MQELLFALKKIRRETGTKQILEFISEHGTAQYKDFQPFMNAHTLNRRLRELLIFGLLEHHIEKEEKRMEFAICIIPSFPAEKRISEIELTEKGDIERAKYPNNWDDLDWQVYYSMKKNPNLSFGKVGGNLGVSWTTIQIHFKKILKDIDIWVSFYPKGYGYYQQALLKFKTKYEKDLESELRGIDRSSFLYKYEENLLLYVFYEDYKDLRRFETLKKEGKIRDLSFSTPIAWD